MRASHFFEFVICHSRASGKPGQSSTYEDRECDGNTKGLVFLNQPQALQVQQGLHRHQRITEKIFPAFNRAAIAAHGKLVHKH